MNPSSYTPMGSKNQNPSKLGNWRKAIYEASSTPRSRTQPLFDYKPKREKVNPIRGEQN